MTEPLTRGQRRRIKRPAPVLVIPSRTTDAKCGRHSTSISKVLAGGALTAEGSEIRPHACDAVGGYCDDACPAVIAFALDPDQVGTGAQVLGAHRRSPGNLPID